MSYYVFKKIKLFVSKSKNFYKIYSKKIIFYTCKHHFHNQNFILMRIDFSIRSLNYQNIFLKKIFLKTSIINKIRVKINLTYFTKLYRNISLRISYLQK